MPRTESESVGAAFKVHYKFYFDVELCDYD
jgi:hypothetical protein